MNARTSLVLMAIFVSLSAGAQVLPYAPYESDANYSKYLKEKKEKDRQARLALERTAKFKIIHVRQTSNGVESPYTQSNPVLIARLKPSKAYIESRKHQRILHALESVLNPSAEVRPRELVLESFQVNSVGTAHLKYYPAVAAFLKYKIPFNPADYDVSYFVRIGNTEFPAFADISEPKVEDYILPEFKPVNTANATRDPNHFPVADATRFKSLNLHSNPQLGAVRAN